MHQRKTKENPDVEKIFVAYIIKWLLNLAIMSSAQVPQIIQQKIDNAYKLNAFYNSCVGNEAGGGAPPQNCKFDVRIMRHKTGDPPENTLSEPIVPAYTYDRQTLKQNFMSWVLPEVMTRHSSDNLATTCLALNSYYKPSDNSAIDADTRLSACQENVFDLSSASPGQAGDVYNVKPYFIGNDANSYSLST